MTKKKSNIYLLLEYGNSKNILSNRYEREDESRIKYDKDNYSIELTETNSLIEEKYCLNMKTAKIIIEGSVEKNEVKESMIHHHPFGHPWKHLQFKLTSDNKVIRIDLEPLDESDYIKCIKGFLCLSQELIKIEQKDNNIVTDLISYFYNEDIKNLNPFRIYLLKKIELAYTKGKMFNEQDKAIDKFKLNDLKSEKLLLPFLKW